MSTQVVGPYLNNNEQVIQTDVDYTLNKGDRVCVVTEDDVTITFPPNPDTGEEHVIVADTGVEVNVTGSANLAEGMKVLPETNRKWTWTGAAWTS